jgi:hypothetical protein
LGSEQRTSLDPLLRKLVCDLITVVPTENEREAERCRLEFLLHIRQGYVCYMTELIAQPLGAFHTCRNQFRNAPQLFYTQRGQHIGHLPI